MECLFGEYSQKSKHGCVSLLELKAGTKLKTDSLDYHFQNHFLLQNTVGEGI